MNLATLRCWDTARFKSLISSFLSGYVKFSAFSLYFSVIKEHTVSVSFVSSALEDFPE